MWAVDVGAEERLGERLADVAMKRGEVTRERLIGQQRKKGAALHAGDRLEPV